MNAELEKPASRLPRRHSAWYFRGCKFAPDVVFDIGVFDGTPWLYRSFPKARFVLIDPQAECEQRVADKLESFDFHAVALGEAEGMTTLNVPETKPGRGGGNGLHPAAGGSGEGAVQFCRASRGTCKATRWSPVRVRRSRWIENRHRRVRGTSSGRRTGNVEAGRLRDCRTERAATVRRSCAPQPCGGDIGQRRVGVARRSERSHLFRKTPPPALHGHVVCPVAGMIQPPSPRPRASKTRDKETRTWFN